MAVVDFNSDGKLDLTVANPSVYCGVCLSYLGSIGVLLGNGDGTFQTEVSYNPSLMPWDSPSFVAVGDLNGDGKPDLAETDGDTVGVLLGNGDGTFQTAMNYARGQGRSGVRVADFNGDGALDLSFLSGGALSILPNIRGTIAQLQSSPNPSVLGQPVTLTATIHASLSAGLSVPTGTVAFVDGTTELGGQSLDPDGVATRAIATAVTLTVQ